MDPVNLFTIVVLVGGELVERRLERVSEKANPDVKIVVPPRDGGR